ncbi:DNA polymerase III, delta subunit [Selenomonas sp. GACV-9]|uniref:DNA polymerase III subunit delta n=1 Tax=Selenomonas sp. GACV-9 TaxID=3158782 RepID=UPI0008EEF4ED|nr:DNA polymerase III, delta subunit [Selenomonas ruminantium]
MNFGEFMVKLRQKQDCHLFLLAGEEHYYIDKALAKILAGLFPDQQDVMESVQKINADIDTDDLIGMIETAPFFVDKNVLLIHNTTLFKDKAKAEGEKKAASKDKKMERLLAALADMPDFSYIIFVTGDKADKRRKLYKTIEKYGLVLEAEAIRAWNINDWLQGKLQAMNRDMDRDAYAYFQGAVSMMQQISLEFLDREFDKLALFSKERRITKSDLVKVFAGLPEVSIFALMDAISERNSRKALMLLRRQLADGTYFTVILSLLTRHVRQLWQAKVLQGKGIRGKALAKPMELNPFIAEKIGRAAMQFPEAVLKAAMLELIDADYWLKTGQAGEEILEHTVIRLCAKA